ncbi:hypothetical protein [Micromonospora sp. NPDC050200]|uniref:hypothetical protein n=1 Tax=Micromonospora sp. NPDC050200 TaxID=3155664 RepID=UPI0033C7FF90
MTSPWPNPPQLPGAPRVDAPVFPAQTLTLTLTLTVDDPHPDAYTAIDGVVTIPPHLLGLAPLVDPALRGVA